MFDDWSPPILRFLDRVNGPPFPVDWTCISEVGFVISILAFSIAFLEIRMLSNRCRSVKDDSDNGSCFEVEVKSTGEQDGGRAVIVLGPETSIPTDGGVGTVGLGCRGNAAVTITID
jgi:hypothetical protein